MYDGPSNTSKLVATLSEINTIPPPVFSTGPSLTMSVKFGWGTRLDISYTSTDQGANTVIFTNISTNKDCVLTFVLQNFLSYVQKDIYYI